MWFDVLEEFEKAHGLSSDRDGRARSSDGQGGSEPWSNVPWRPIGRRPSRGAVSNALPKANRLDAVARFTLDF